MMQCVVIAAPFVVVFGDCVCLYVCVCLHVSVECLDHVLYQLLLLGFSCATTTGARALMVFVLGPCVLLGTTRIASVWLVPTTCPYSVTCAAWEVLLIPPVSPASRCLDKDRENV